MEVKSSAPGHCALILHIVKTMTEFIKNWPYKQLTPKLYLQAGQKEYHALQKAFKDLNESLEKIVQTAVMRKWELHYEFFNFKYRNEVSEISQVLLQHSSDKKQLSNAIRMLQPSYTGNQLQKIVETLTNIQREIRAESGGENVGLNVHVNVGDFKVEKMTAGHDATAFKLQVNHYQQAGSGNDRYKKKFDENMLFQTLVWFWMPVEIKASETHREFEQKMTKWLEVIKQDL